MDNIELASGSGGATIRTDDDGSAHWQYVKLAYGADNTQNIVTSTATNPLPVALSDTDNAVLDTIDAVLDNIYTVLGTIDTDTGNCATLLGTIDTDTGNMATLLGTIDTDTGNIATSASSIDGKITACNTGSIAGTVTANAGTNLNTSALALESGGNLATIAGDTTSLDSKVTACNTGAVVIASGTVTTVTTVTTVSAVTAITNALPAGDNNIGNVDIVSLPAGNLGQQAMAASVSIVPASNITDATYIGDIKFGESLPAGTNAIGKLAANSGVDIGDVDVTSIAAGTNTIGGVISQSSSSAAYDGTTACTIKRFNIIVTGDNDTVISAPSGTKKILVRSLAIIAMSATESEVYFETGTTGTDTLGDSSNGFLISLDADGNNVAGLTLQHNPDGWFKTADADEALKIRMSSNQPMLCIGTYIEVA